MNYNKIEVNNVIRNYLDEKYDLKDKAYRAFLSFGADTDVYFLELSYKDIWYSISNKHSIIIQESKQRGSYLFEGTDIGLTKDEYFNFCLMEDSLDIVLKEKVNELTKYIYEVLIPLVTT